ncbi:hypothetical protein GALMADRAFT_1328802, partial [Galerina marginata CBS 339.88]
MSKKFGIETLSGDWYNQLGSTVHFAVDLNGGLVGKYISAVGHAEDGYRLNGRFDADPPAGEGVSLGWTVNWRNVLPDGTVNNAHSTTTWSGQYFDESSSVGERIVTNWLLTQSTDPSDIWNSTNVGNDAFTRIMPSAAEISKAKALSFGSPHPQQILAKK